MDRVIKHLSKNHPAFRAFCDAFSQTYFVWDADDKAEVEAVLARREGGPTTWDGSLERRGEPRGGPEGRS
jgi:hypothetical protein